MGSDVTNSTATNGAAAAAAPPTRPKLHGRAFYESIGSPKYIVAPMVDQSEFAWRMLSRSFLPEPQRTSMLAYSPMFHARLFAETEKYRNTHFQPTRIPPSEIPGATATEGVPWLDGNPAIDRPLFVQFCANEPQHLLAAAKLAAPYCDAVDLNLGCPQGIAKRGHYGAFLQEDQELIYNLIHTLHEDLSIPVTAKIRVLETKEATLKYAQNVLRAGASILTVHGRRREQKGHYTGLADWQYIRYLRENLPPETVIFANGNILEHGGLEKCLAATGADGVMSAEGNLSNPGLFAPPPPVGQEGREYWRDKDGRRGGWRVDAVFRRYLDILHKYVLDEEPPQRRPLFMPGDDSAWLQEQPKATTTAVGGEQQQQNGDEPPRKKLDKSHLQSPNFVAIQAHLFHLLRHFVSKHHDVRDALAKSKLGDIGTYEKVLGMVERKVAEGLLEYRRTDGKSVEEMAPAPLTAEEEAEIDDTESSARTVRECWRPWWVVQPIIRPLPKEALAKGAVQPKKKGKGAAMDSPFPASTPAPTTTNGQATGKAATTPVPNGEDASPAAAVPAAVSTLPLEQTTTYEENKLVSG
ncbi:dihydrouridine synthase [Diplogelasinospora grovesii]|uniref:tRNA-dihydrouridine(16/17) synthase [NAD(P)(+)] n=1 Tax=Diplogelasinospora grovesii TaxID=303347 RepID=A0AAN6NC29_9PEZI|nr:dihydrouridine synthase [Diplogelasinospora grovesii]